ncbi:hypothetical protein CH293_18395 [Rhodococcus sp. 14-2470-1b]|uniref:hypothetical protein n=1 Tax=unclassified Rhodococcus (in: high G+C Gram-positive bacteria) TaxID=192944 RepID=UPI000B9A6243|nr:hypothetical protein [Rhodococcus sp. 14-2470-1b]OZF48869.1 hypothetical protein CH293_18395 [Rhodococcus sp. 14-2470-1b]
MTVALAPWHTGLESVLAGSIYAAASGSRVDAARALVDAGISVHVDVMAPGEDLPSGIDAAELAELAHVVPQSMLGIHLIGSAAGVRKLLPTIPDCGDLYVPIGIRDERDCRLWAAVWDEFDDTAPTAADLKGYHGVLVMLLQPGTSGTADPDRLGFVRMFSAHGNVTVDGGVTPELIPRCRSAGATTLVVGRALLTDHTLPEGQS